MIINDKISFQLPWVVQLKKNAIPILLDAAPLPVRYLVFRDILEDTSSPDFEALQKNLRKHQPRRKKLAAQNSQGLWPIAGSVKGLDGRQIQTMQFLAQVEALHELSELLLTEKSEKAMLGMREVVRYLAEKDLRLRLHPITQAIYLAIHFKLEGSPIIKQLIRDILSEQNADGGWSSLPDDKQSCIWSSLFFLWTMGHSEKFPGNRVLQKGLGYLRENLLMADRSLLLPGLQTWDTLITGSSGLSAITGGSLRYLETLQLYADDRKDRKAEKLLDWLMDIQLKNGLWPSIVGRDRQGDHNVTLRVLKVMKHFQGRRLQEALDYDQYN
ncbi:MAG: hypothetical protein L3J79_00475 [Candidatus Marinimicrobia bacterium]|nr:hypothetical protein [Candidatus Neomarinimicrobiota bacterium]